MRSRRVNPRPTPAWCRWLRWRNLTFRTKSSYHWRTTNQLSRSNLRARYLAKEPKRRFLPLRQERKQPQLPTCQRKAPTILLEWRYQTKSFHKLSKRRFETMWTPQMMNRLQELLVWLCHLRMVSRTSAALSLRARILWTRGGLWLLRKEPVGRDMQVLA